MYVACPSPLLGSCLVPEEMGPPVNIYCEPHFRSMPLSVLHIVLFSSITGRIIMILPNSKHNNLE